LDCCLAEDEEAQQLDYWKKTEESKSETDHSENQQRSKDAQKLLGPLLT
jgi:hypothetical protein